MKKELFLYLLIGGILLNISFVFALNNNSCEEAGNVCQLHSCPQHQERVLNLTCPEETSKGYVCCRDKVYTNIEQKIIVQPEGIEEGDNIDISVQLPTFRDCVYYLIDPSGMEKQEGSGGCGPIGRVTSFSTDRLKELFGTLESGTYQIKVIAAKSNNPNITLIEKFTIGLTGPMLQSLCKVENGEGDCIFLNKTYNVKHIGCNNNITLEFAYDDQKELFGELNQGTSRVFLKDGTEIKLNSAPCSVYMTTILFRKKISNECGNNLCEIKEDSSNCPNDCKELVSLPELEEQNEPNLKCSTGCLYKTNCLPTGVRVGNQYCGIEGEFLLQKEKEENCNNNFECQSGLCIDDSCIEKGLFKKFLEWLKNLFS
ncbi:hypothetical protein HYW74_03505 [Candidatus Pacearchaeota archaeon]|nr:hypothetical protein [Candidatus Pacearchaeota archaeon]